ncbi:hypothetical protein ACUY3P_01895 [Corynebacterium lehmanniae]
MAKIQVEFGAIAQTARHGVVLVDENSQKICTPLMVDVPPMASNPHLELAAGLIWAPAEVKEFHFRGKVSESVVRHWEKALGVVIECEEGSDTYQRNGYTDLSVTAQNRIQETTPGRDETLIYLLPSERFYGSMRGVKEVLMATNSWLFGEDRGAAAEIALGTVFADDLMARSIKTEREMSPEFAERIESILEPLSIDLRVGVK